MTAPRKPHRHQLLPLCLLLVSAGAFAEAREVRMQGPNSGGGECVEAEADTVESDVPGIEAGTKATPATKPAGTSTRIKPVMGVRGGDGGGGHSPRWHSFLPGMFRSEEHTSELQSLMR